MKIEYVCIVLKGFGMELALTQFAVKILFDDSTGFNATEANIMIYILYMIGYGLE